MVPHLWLLPFVYEFLIYNVMFGTFDLVQAAAFLEDFVKDISIQFFPDVDNLLVDVSKF